MLGIVRDKKAYKRNPPQLGRWLISEVWGKAAPPGVDPDGDGANGRPASRGGCAVRAAACVQRAARPAAARTGLGGPPAGRGTPRGRFRRSPPPAGDRVPGAPCHEGPGWAGWGGWGRRGVKTKYINGENKIFLDV